MGRSKWFLFIPVLLFTHPLAEAAQWRFIPSLTLRETFTDNINLEPDGESAWVTEFNPGIYITNRQRNLAGGGGFGGGGFGGGGFGGGGFGGGGFGGGGRQRGRMLFDLNYRMQNIFSTQNGRGYDLRHQLQAAMSAELLRNAVYLDTSASAGQTLVDPSGIQAIDNLNNTGNRTDFYTFFVSPYWRPHFAGYAEGEVRVSYGYVLTPDATPKSSQRHAETVQLVSGHRFNILTWRASFRNDETLYAGKGSQDVLLRNGLGELRYRWTHDFSTFVRGGFNDSSFQSRTNTNQNGFFWTVGGRWQPTRLFMVEAGYGNNYFVTVRITPTRRTLLEGTYMHNRVGTITGDVWRALIRHRTKRTVWQGRYFEDTTTSQSVLFDRQVFGLVDAFGNPINDPATGQQIQVFIDNPVLVDEAIQRKRGELMFTGRTAKNTFNVRVYAERRQYQVTDREDKIYGINGNWSWRWGSKTFTSVFSNWQNSKFNYGQGEAQEDSTQIFWTTAFTLGRRLGKNVFAYLQYRHQAQISKKGDSLDYNENRAVAAINMWF